MTMRSTPVLTRILLIALLSAVIPSDAFPATQCDLKGTVSDCWERAFKELNAQIPGRKEVTNEEMADLQAMPTGIDTGGVNLASNTKDFLPLLALSGLLGDSAKAGSDGTYVIDLNFLIPGLAQDNNAQLQAVVNSQPKVSGELADQLPEATRDDTVKKLEGTLGSTDDYAVSFTYNWIDRYHGRGFKQYGKRFSALVQAVSARSAPAREKGQSQASSDLGTYLSNQDEFNDFDALNTPFDEIADLATRAELKEVTEGAIDQEAAKLTSDRKAFADAGLLHFADLLDNQPQLYFSAQKRFRAALVGGDETSFKLTYSWALTNFNHAMSDACHVGLDNETPSKEILSSCLDQYSGFVKSNSATLKDGTKFSFSAEYMNVAKDEIDLPAQGLTGLTLNAAKKVIVSAGWTRLFSAGEAGGQPVRLDLIAKYENVTDDPERRDRGVATLTVTRKFGTLTIPFGIVYANHGEFLGQVDRQLSAHLGLKFDLTSNQGTP
jgi:hypothetical protein